MTNEGVRRVAVIGGGPAGLMAAETLSGAGHRVTVFDRMPSLGRKFLMAGRGGLNLTHAEPEEPFRARFGPEAAELAPALACFRPDDLRAWCDELDQPTFVGSSGRVFPVDLKASPLLRAWLARLAATGVENKTRHRWLGFGDGRELLFETPAGPVTERPDAVVLALGGASWARLGSDGRWAEPLAAAGHGVAPFRPANVRVSIGWSVHLRERFAGTPLKRIALAVGETTVRGEVVVTADGLEGGAVYGLTRPLRDLLDRDGTVVLVLDLRPDLAPADVARALARPRGRQSAATFLRKVLKLPPVAIALLHENAGRTLPTDPARLAALVKGVRLPVTGFGPLDRAISTAGGLRLAELDEHAMLRGRPGVFAAGEMLDWEAPTGGYLLTACFATGRAAGLGAARWLAESR